MIRELTNGKNGNYPVAIRCHMLYIWIRMTVWLTDFGTNVIVRFDPTKDKFVDVITQPTPGADFRQLLGKT